MRNLLTKAWIVALVAVYPYNAWGDLLGGGGAPQNTGGGSGFAIVSDALSTGSVCLLMLAVLGGYLLRRRLISPKATLQPRE